GGKRVDDHGSDAGVGGGCDYADGDDFGSNDVAGYGERVDIIGRSGWDVVYRFDGVAEVESGGEGLDDELLHSAERVRDRRHGVVEHGIGERGFVGGGGD